MRRKQQSRELLGRQDFRRFINQLHFVIRCDRIAFDQAPFDAVFKKRMDNRAIVDNALWTKE